MSQEKEWWLEKIRAAKLLHGDVDYADIREIVEEATCRGIEQGKREAWAEAKEIVVNFTPSHITRDYKDTDSMRDNIIHVFNAELATLSNPSKE